MPAGHLRVRRWLVIPTSEAQEGPMEPEQTAVAESIDRLTDHIDALAAAIQAAAETLAGALRHVSPPPQMTAQGVQE